MRIKHRIPLQALEYRGAEITPEYQAEVDRSVARAENREAVAQRRLQAAEAKLAKAQKIKARAQRERAVLVARELVEMRRQELLAVQRQMNSAPSSARTRGRGHKKQPIPNMHTL